MAYMYMYLRMQPDCAWARKTLMRHCARRTQRAPTAENAMLTAACIARIVLDITCRRMLSIIHGDQDASRDVRLEGVVTNCKLVIADLIDTLWAFLAGIRGVDRISDWPGGGGGVVVVVVMEVVG